MRATGRPLAKIFTDYFNGDGSWHSSPPERRQAVASQLPPNRHEWDAGAPLITAERFNGIVARGMVLRGTETRLVLRETSNVLAQAFPQWELHDIAGAGHMGPLTHSAVVHERIKAFLVEQGRDDGRSSTPSAGQNLAFSEGAWNGTGAEGCRR